MLKVEALCIAMVLSWFCVKAQYQNYSYQIIDENSGLPQNFVYSIAQDHTGFIWIGTGKGLMRYEGRQTQSFFKKHGLSDSFITASLSSSSGHIFYGHYDGSISAFNGVFHWPLLNDSLQSEIVAICEDENSNIWCASKSGGVIQIQSHLQVHKTIFPGELQGKVINDMLILGNQLLIATSEGIYSFLISGSQLIFKDAPGEIQFEDIKSLAKDVSDSLGIWAGTAANIIYQIKAGAVTTIKSKQSITNSNSLGILSMVEDRDHILWIGTQENGLICLRIAGEKDKNHNIQTFNHDTGYPIQSVRKVFIDSTGNVWVGTLSDGVIKLHKPPLHFVSVQHLGIDLINDIQIKSGVCYLATSNGLFLYLRNVDNQNQYELRSVSHFKNQNLISVSVASDSVLWVSTATNSLVIFNQKTGEKKNIFLTSVSGEKVQARFIRLDRNGNGWISSVGNGVYKISRDGKSLLHLTTQNGFIHNDIYSIYPDEKGSIWFGSLGAGLAKLDSTGALNLFSQKALFPSHDVNDITGDKQGAIWIATDGQGYFQYDGKRFSSPAGEIELTLPFIKGIGYDAAPGLWLTHRNGISFIDLATLDQRNFTKEDGVLPDLSYASKIAIDHNNVIINNGVGFTVIENRNDIRRIQVNPVLTGVKLFFTEPIHVTPTMSDIKQHLFPAFKLPYNQNHLTFYFTSVEQSFRGEVYYRYFIKEIEPQWSPATTTDHVTYPSLNPGKYTLGIQASIDPNRWNNKPLEYTFIIEPPFWGTWWFYFIMSLFISGVLSVLIFILRRKR